MPSPPPSSIINNSDNMPIVNNNFNPNNPGSGSGLPPPGSGTGSSSTGGIGMGIGSGGGSGPGSGMVSVSGSYPGRSGGSGGPGGGGRFAGGGIDVIERGRGGGGGGYHKNKVRGGGGGNKQNLNYLLGFTPPSRSFSSPNSNSNSSRAGMRRSVGGHGGGGGGSGGAYGYGGYGTATGWIPGGWNKERFVHAQHRFVIKPNYDPTPHLQSPDTSIPWSEIIQVLIPIGSSLRRAQQPQPSSSIMNLSDPTHHDQHQHKDKREHVTDEVDRAEGERNGGYPACPICLERPRAGRMTKCGHVFCYPCILHFLELSDHSYSSTQKDNKWQPCPVCGEDVWTLELKAIGWWDYSYSRHRNGDDNYLGVGNKVGMGVGDDVMDLLLLQQQKKKKKGEGESVEGKEEKYEKWERTLSGNYVLWEIEEEEGWSGRRKPGGFSFSSSSSREGKESGLRRLTMRLMERRSDCAIPVPVAIPSRSTEGKGEETSRTSDIPDSLSTSSTSSLRFSKILLATPPYYLNRSLLLDLKDLEQMFRESKGDEVERGFVARVKARVEREVQRVREVVSESDDGTGEKRLPGSSKEAVAEEVGIESWFGATSTAAKNSQVQKVVGGGGKERAISATKGPRKNEWFRDAAISSEDIKGALAGPRGSGNKLPESSPTTSTSYRFYQAASGELLFLSPLDNRLLKEDVAAALGNSHAGRDGRDTTEPEDLGTSLGGPDEFKHATDRPSLTSSASKKKGKNVSHKNQEQSKPQASPDQLPLVIDIPIEHIHYLRVSLDTRKRYRWMGGGVALGSEIGFVEVGGRGPEREERRRRRDEREEQEERERREMQKREDKEGRRWRETQEKEWGRWMREMPSLLPDDVAAEVAGITINGQQSGQEVNNAQSTATTSNQSGRNPSTSLPGETRSVWGTAIPTPASAPPARSKMGKFGRDRDLLEDDEEDDDEEARARRRRRGMEDAWKVWEEDVVTRRAQDAGILNLDQQVVTKVNDAGIKDDVTTAAAAAALGTTGGVAGNDPIGGKKQKKQKKQKTVLTLSGGVAGRRR